jgi:hypothetical protein
MNIFQILTLLGKTIWKSALKGKHWGNFMNNLNGRLNMLGGNI